MSIDPARRVTILSRAKSTMAARLGQTVDAITEKTVEALKRDGGAPISAEAVREVIVDGWHQINAAYAERAAAGSGGADAARDPRLAPNVALLPEHLTAGVGTDQATGCVDFQGHEYTIEGTEYWDLAPQKSTSPARRLTEGAIRSSWNRDHGEAKFPGISGAEIAALTKPGPHGEPPKVRPGDCIINGGGGDAGHVSVFIGNDDRGQPRIIHAMATEHEGRNRAEHLRDVLDFARGKDFKTGVLSEGLDTFFDRYHRDTVAVVRPKKPLTPEQIDTGLTHVRTLVGADYDYKMLPSDASRPTKGDRYYCTEIYIEFLKAALDNDRQKLPHVGTTYYRQGTPLQMGIVGVDAHIAEPQNLLASNDFDLVLTLGKGADAVTDIRATHVVALKGAISRP